MEYQSFNKYPRIKDQEIKKIFWKNQIPDINSLEKKVLPYGKGKSYGDSCLNENGILIDIANLNRFISFDDETGVMRCESGVTLEQILDLIVPKGWFLPVTPGTKLITVGGAIANDVHGKNHHRDGTFGCHVIKFELVRSDGTYICSEEENTELFNATIGGLGLTGLITWVEFKNKKVPSPFLAIESVKFKNLDEFYEIDKESEKDWRYVVSWVDTSSKGENLGRGLYGRGNFADPEKFNLPNLKEKKKITFPIEAPLINGLSVKAFNILYYSKQLKKVDKSITHYDPFFYPLDAVYDWNKAYGKKGFLQYQFVIPFGNHRDALKDIMTLISKSGLSSFLTVLKRFGDVKSPGMLSFPKPGITMAVDFRMDGKTTLDKLKEIDKLVIDAGGILYPAKDARMSAQDFQKFYPQWQEFEKYIDPKFSSSFWRRVTNNTK